jgi:hypothetical protein
MEPIVSDSFVIVDWMDPGTHPRRPIAGLHLHRRDDEAWIVLEGRLGFRVGEEEREVPAGGSLLVEHGTPHAAGTAGRCGPNDGPQRTSSGRTDARSSRSR